MKEQKQTFKVFIDNKIVAENVTLDILCILVKGIYETYYADTNLKVSILPDVEDDIHDLFTQPNISIHEILEQNKKEKEND